MVGVREIDRSLEQWQMGVKDLRRRVLLAPTPRERERWYALLLLAQGWRHRRRRKPWNGTLTPLDDGWRPSARAGPEP